MGWMGCSRITLCMDYHGFRLCPIKGGWTLDPRWSCTPTTSSKIHPWPRFTDAPWRGCGCVIPSVSWCRYMSCGYRRILAYSLTFQRCTQITTTGRVWLTWVWKFLFLSVLTRLSPESCHAMPSVMPSLEAFEGFVAPVPWCNVNPCQANRGDAMHKFVCW